MTGDLASAIPALPLPAARAPRFSRPAGVRALPADAGTPLYDLQAWIAGGDPITGERPTIAHAHAGIVAHTHGVQL